MYLASHEPAQDPLLETQHSSAVSYLSGCAHFARKLAFLFSFHRTVGLSGRLTSAVASLLREGLGENYKDLKVLGRSRLCGLLPSNPVWSSEGVLRTLYPTDQTGLVGL